MKRKITWYLLVLFFSVIWWLSWALVNADEWDCDWIKLNTDFPIIWHCISIKDRLTAFPTMMGAISKIVVSLILIVCFISVIYAWIMRSADKPTEAKKLLTKVAIAMLLLWFSWVILRLINPNFFG